MTREEFLAKAKRENWSQDYVDGMLEVVDSAAKKGIKIPYYAILATGPGVEV